MNTSLSFPSFSSSNGLAEIREWLMTGGNPKERLEDGEPCWVQAMKLGWVDGVDELLAAGADPNQRSADGNGWLHWCILTHMPFWLVNQGFQKLQRTLSYPNDQGISPFHLPHVSPELLNIMRIRWWSEGRKTSF